MKWNNADLMEIDLFWSRTKTEGFRYNVNMFLKNIQKGLSLPEISDIKIRKLDGAVVSILIKISEIAIEF